MNLLNKFLDRTEFDSYEDFYENYNLKYKSNNYNTNTSSNRNGGSWIERIFGKWSD